VLLAGRVFVVAGYGWCGQGLALRARGMGARVVVCEVDPLRALEAVMEGFEVLPMQRAAAIGDVFCTATGDRDEIRREHFALMKDGALLANAGHFNVEIDIAELRALSTAQTSARAGVEGFVLPNGRRLYLLAEGRLVNLAAAEGHPATVMDMSFSNQALSVEYALQYPLERKVHGVPREIDDEIARLKLESLAIEIDQLSDEQAHYLASWNQGT
jgi:adenosylhomocysteinase